MKKLTPNRRRRRTPIEKSPLSETSDDDGFSSTNTTASNQSKTVNVNKKATRGRPRKNPIVQPSPSTVAKSPALAMPTTTAPKTTTKKEPAAAKKAPTARARNPRQNLNIKSRETVSTDSSSDEDEIPPTVKINNNSTPPNRVANARKPFVSPRQQATVATKQQNFLSSPTSRSPHQPILRPGSVPAVRNNSISPGSGRVPSRQSRLSSSSSSETTTSSSSEEESDSSSENSDSSSKVNEKVNKEKSDKIKNDTLRKLFSWGSKAEGGAKGKGQVVIVDSEEAQQHHQLQTKENSISNEKLLSPYAYNNNRQSIMNFHNGNNNSNNNNNGSINLTNGSTGSELSALKANNNLGLSKSQTTLSTSSQPIICRIDLSRLNHVPTDRNFKINRGKSPNNVMLPRRRDSPLFTKRDDERLSTGRSPVDFGQNTGRRSQNSFVDDEVNNRLSNSRDSSCSSTTTSSKHRDIENSGSVRNSSTRFDDITSNASTKDRNKHNNMNNNNYCNNDNYMQSPKMVEKLMGKSIKREGVKNEFSNNDYNTGYINSTKSPKILDEKFHSNQYVNSHINNKLKYDNNGANDNIKRENIKIESTYSSNNLSEDTSKIMTSDDFIANNRKKRSPSANSSPYKHSKRKKLLDDPLDQVQMPPTNHDRLDANLLPPPQKPIVQKVYVSYFERTNDDRDEIR